MTVPTYTLGPRAYEVGIDISNPMIAPLNRMKLRDYGRPAWILPAPHRGLVRLVADAPRLHALLPLGTSRAVDVMLQRLETRTLVVFLVCSQWQRLNRATLSQNDKGGAEAGRVSTLPAIAKVFLAEVILRDGLCLVLCQSLLLCDIAVNMSSEFHHEESRILHELEHPRLGSVLLHPRHSQFELLRPLVEDS